MEPDGQFPCSKRFVFITVRVKYPLCKTSTIEMIHKIKDTNKELFHTLWTNTTPCWKWPKPKSNGKYRNITVCAREFITVNLTWVLVMLLVFSWLSVEGPTDSQLKSTTRWRPRRFKWTRLFRRKTKNVFCACAILFQLTSTNAVYKQYNSWWWDINMPETCRGWLTKLTEDKYCTKFVFSRRIQTDRDTRKSVYINLQICSENLQSRTSQGNDDTHT
jgi:hypothetical protein